MQESPSQSTASPGFKGVKGMSGRKENIFGTHDTGFSHKIIRLGIVCVRESTRSADDQ